MRFFAIVLLWFLSATPHLSAAKLMGRVTNAENQPLPAVSVVTDLELVGTMTDENGYFELKLPPGETVTRVTFSSVGYEARQFRLSAVPDVVRLEASYYHGTDILVRGDRAERGSSPVAFDNFTAEQIKRDYTVGEFPLLLATTPNLFTYSDGGASLGYVYTSIRGFDDKRITTYINGVPLNDPEWQATYFADLPDFAANIDDIQVQRGLGNSLYGDASFGGTINVVTRTLSRPRRVVVTSGFGQYTAGGQAVADIYKQSIDYSSGLIDGRWQFTGRFSKQKTDGYRQHSWYEGWSYYFGLARVDRNMTTEFYAYGGPIKMHLAFWGATREAIDANRRYNPLTYANETDNFNQPHYHLHHTWQLDSNIILSNTLYYIRGKGYYEQFAAGSVYADYGIGSRFVDVDIATGNIFETGDLVRQDRVEKNQFGWNPRLDIDHASGRHTIGGSLYYFESDHTGRVTWAQHLRQALDPQHKFYQWQGKQWAGSFYAEEKRRLSEQWSFELTAQMRYQRFRLTEDQVGAFLGHAFTMDWLTFSPRIGTNYQPTEQWGFFASVATSSRPPIVATIYDGTNPNLLPRMTVDAVNHDSTEYSFGEPLTTAERVYDFELGSNYKSERMALTANLFWMDFHDEILPYGPVNSYTGLRSAVNAARTVHAGVELAATVKPWDVLQVDGNFSFNYNRVKDFKFELDGYDVDFADKKIAGFPDHIGNLVIDFETSGWQVVNHVNYIGRRYLELQNVESLSLDPYLVAAVSVAYTLENFLQIGNLTFLGRVDNWANKKYESYGYGGDFAYGDGSGNVIVDGWAEYFVAAERSFFGQLRMEMF